MKIQTMFTVAAGAATLLVTTSTVAFAQARVAECNQLDEMVIEAEESGDILDVFANVRNVIRKNDVEECTFYIRRVERAGGMTVEMQEVNATRATVAGSDVETVDTEAAEGETTAAEGFSTSETLTRTVEIEQRAIVEGEVVARIPDPEIGVNIPGAQVSVEQPAADVSVKQSAMTVVVRQPAAEIGVTMPAPVITISQPAPEIFIEMEDPEIAMNQPAPNIRVVMPEPTITVTQGEPELDVAVNARLVDGNEVLPENETPLRTRAERIGLDGAVRMDDAEMAAATVQAGEATVDMVEATEATRYTFNRTQPTVRFEGTDPTVTMQMDGEPTINFTQVGEAVIRFSGMEEAEAEDAERAEMLASRTNMDAATSRELMLENDADREMRAGATMVSLRADQISGMDVYGRNDEYVGDIDRIVQVDGKIYVIVEHGGFLGIGDTEVALPVEQVAIRGEDRAVLLGMTEEQFDALPDVDFDGRSSLMANDSAIEIGRFE